MKLESKFAIFNYQDRDKELIKEVATYLDDNVDKIFNFFEVEILKEKITINIIPTKKEFDEIYKYTWNCDAENWSIGFYSSKTKQITYLSINDYKNTSHAFEKNDYSIAKEYYKKTILHEFVHYVNDLFKIKHNCGYTEKYLSEGLATYLSKQKSDKKINFNYSMDQILNSKGCYDGWYLITKYLIENYDKQFIFSLIESNRKAREFLQNELYNKASEYYKVEISKRSE